MKWVLWNKYCEIFFKNTVEVPGYLEKFPRKIRKIRNISKTISCFKIEKLGTWVNCYMKNDSINLTLWAIA